AGGVDAGRVHALPHIPTTRTWHVVMTGGPAGICSADWQRCGPGKSSAGEPLTSTRAAGASHLTVTQGCGLLLTLNAQPAMTPISAAVATGWPETSTRVLLL